MNRDELVLELARFDDEILEIAYRAAVAADSTGKHGHYFMHDLVQEERIIREDGTVIVRMPVSKWLHNPAHMMHGGMTAFLCDNAMGMASYVEKQRPGVTLELTVRYHKPARDGVVSAYGRVVATGSVINSTQCEVRGDDGTLIATASGTFYHWKPAGK